jgi:hypothetical protein
VAVVLDHPSRMAGWRIYSTTNVAGSGCQKIVSRQISSDPMARTFICLLCFIFLSPTAACRFLFVRWWSTIRLEWKFIGHSNFSFGLCDFFHDYFVLFVSVTDPPFFSHSSPNPMARIWICI